MLPVPSTPMPAGCGRCRSPNTPFLQLALDAATTASTSYTRGLVGPLAACATAAAGCSYVRLLQLR